MMLNVKPKQFHFNSGKWTKKNQGINITFIKMKEITHNEKIKLLRLGLNSLN